MWGKQNILLYYISGFFIVSSHAQDLIKNNEKLNIDIFYESLCPDSLNFIEEQLYPNWKDISAYVNVNFVPFGKSTSLENGTRFACQHGSLECKGNRIMSCALNRIEDQTLQVDYVACFMQVYRRARINENEYGQQCAEKVGLDFAEIMANCYQTKEGTILQLEAEDNTKKVSPTFIPTIVYNGVLNQKRQSASLYSFGDVVCNLIKHTYPEACSYRSNIRI